MPPLKLSFHREQSLWPLPHSPILFFPLLFLFTPTGCINLKKNFKLWHIVRCVCKLCVIVIIALILTVTKWERHEATLGLERTSQAAFKCRPRALCWWWQWWLIPPMVWNCELWLLIRTAQHQELHSCLQPWWCWETAEMRCNRRESKPL